MKLTSKVVAYLRKGKKYSGHEAGVVWWWVEGKEKKKQWKEQQC